MVRKIPKFDDLIFFMESYTLFELNRLIRNTLDAHLEPSYWVTAEIGEMRNNQKGHCYMELVEKQDDEVIAKMRANIWAYTYRNLSGWFEAITGQTLHAGVKILANVAVQFHELYGMCLIVKDIDATYTLGERVRRRGEAIEKLKAEGVFDMNRELELAAAPQRIAVISSPSAAGYGDFVDQLMKNRFNYRFEITLFKALMQGSEASDSIIQALHEVHCRMDDFDALAIVRGGGAQVDLDCFDSYELAAHVAQFPLPVIAGIGHERDETIVDLVAHTRMKTPTAVAEFLVGRVRGIEEKLDALFRNVAAGARNLIAKHRFRLTDLTGQARYCVASRVIQLRNKLEMEGDRLKHCSEGVIERQSSRLLLLKKSLSYLDPANVLKRGYSISAIGNKIIRNIEEAKAGDTMRTFVSDGIITSKIEKTQENG